MTLRLSTPGCPDGYVAPAVDHPGYGETQDRAPEPTPLPDPQSPPPASPRCQDPGRDRARGED